MTDLTYGSICTGYDGIGRGLALAGLTLRHNFIAEAEPSVAKLHDASIPNVGDIKVADWPDVPRVDILSSGDPCQSISIAGRREGRDDPRFLWPWVRDAYRALGPRVVFLENVQGMVSHDGGNTMRERFENLREDGYAVRWTVLGACAIGAPHHRHRWFALAWRVSGPVPEAVRMGGSKAVCGAPRGGARTLLPTPNAREGGGRGFPSREHALRRAEDPMRSLNLEDAVALLPTPCARDGEGRNEGDAEYWKRKFEREPHRSITGVPLGAAVNLLPTPRATDGVNGGPGQRGSSGDLAMPPACQPQYWGRYAGAVELWERIAGTPAPTPTVPGPNGGARLNPALPEWMMGLPAGTLTDHMSRNDALKAAGNGCVPQQVAAAWRMLSDGVL